MAAILCKLPLRMTSSPNSHRLSTVLNHIIKMDGRSQSTAGIIVIGDEILKGQTADTNSNFICKHLFSLGVTVKKISVIGDDKDTIAEEVAHFSNSYTHVITSGGIGPTHDDKTLEGIAKAFSEETYPHPQLVELIKGYFGTDDLTSPKMKMAFIPKSATLKYGVNKITGKKALYPLVSVKNVHMFPGVPAQLERAFHMLEKELFMNPGVEFHTMDMFINKDEMTIASVLNQADEKFRKEVMLGSYPVTHNSYYKVRLTLESLDEDKLGQVCQYLTERLPQDSVVMYEKDPVSAAVKTLYTLVESDEDTVYANNVRHAVKVIEEGLKKYSLEEICVGFNGGKDCTALLHLCHAVFKKMYPDSKANLNALYIRSKLPFPEVEEFIQVSRDRYNLEMLRFEGRIKNSMSELQEQHPKIKAVIMGTRRTDPYSDHLESFSMTDPDWPQFMRINPLLEWQYSDVWTFLRSFCLPYCSLYDRGYTSLGSMNNTHPNPRLQYRDDKGVVYYRAAYELDQHEKERDGRN
ncbi:FAD synthase-like [Haliotis rubra]|uniref:FAD synthase-like n=1 Tax=Haliotis rubra TaxID=36100 RepID=UPI001EE59DAA|nr:FAD synthase-like [Haliotis rubra]